jgi:hypothetical protein
MPTAISLPILADYAAKTACFNCQIADFGSHNPHNSFFIPIFAYHSAHAEPPKLYMHD